MEADDRDLIDLADAILEGREIDWSAVDARGSDPDGRIVGQLRVLQAFATLHRQLPDAASDPGPSRTTGSAGDPDRQQWGHLRLHELVGRGAFGEVYRAWDTRLDREVALKLLQAGPASMHVDSTVIAEGRLLARIRHPNVLAVYGAERIGDRVGIWTEFVRGRTLADLVRSDGPVDERKAIGIGIEVCRALEAVHGAGLLHRDVKAENVMREESGRIVLMDLGAGAERLIEERGRGREIAGTPLYVAPEILEGTRATPQSDVYSVGVLLYHLVTGSYPVRASSLDAVRRAHHQQQHAPLAAAGERFSPAFAESVDRATAADLRQRHPSAPALEAALHRALQKLGEPLASTPRTEGRGRLWMIGTAALITAAVGIVAFGAAAPPGTRGPSGGAAVVTALPQPVMRKVTTPDMGLFSSGAPSFDGRFYANTDLNQDLMVFGLADGTVHRLTDHGDADVMAGRSVLSPDGRAVAFEWTGAGRYSELRSMSTDGRDVRVLLAIQGVDVHPIEWSRDGRWILCMLRTTAAVSRLALVSPLGGEPSMVGEFNGFTPRRVSLSPDSAFLVYDAPAADGSPQRDILVQPLRGGPPSVLHAHPAEDDNPLWTPDGRSVFFVSNRSATVDGWILPVAGGVAQGEPVMVARNIGRIGVAGFTASGSLYYWLQSGDMDVFTVPLDGGPAPPARVVSRVAGGNSGPAWSPDGRFFAYVSQRIQMTEDPRAVIVVRDEQARTERELTPPMRRIAPVPLRWSPDSRELLVRGNRGGNPGAYVLDVASGRLEPAVTTDDAHISDIGQMRWWVEPRTVAYLSPRGLTARDLRTGTERVVLNPSLEGRRLRLSSFDLSPDRQSVAFTAVVTGTEPVERILAVMPLGGTPRVLARVAMPEQMVLQSWLAAADDLLVTRWDTRRGPPHALWRVSARDGAARDTGISIPGFTQANLAQANPAATTVAYTANEANWDLWVIEQFLPGLHR